jgi:hypothetical protein
MLDGRHVDEVTARQSDVRSDARALLRDRLFGNLDDDLLTLAQKISDGRLAAVATAAALASALRRAPAGVPVLLATAIVASAFLPLVIFALALIATPFGAASAVASAFVASIVVATPAPFLRGAFLPLLSRWRRRGLGLNYRLTLFDDYLSLLALAVGAVFRRRSRAAVAT